MDDKPDRFDIAFFSQAEEDFEATQFRFFAALRAAEEKIENKYLFPLVENMVQFNKRIGEFKSRVTNERECWRTELKSLSLPHCNYGMDSDGAWLGDIENVLKFINEHRSDLENMIEKGRDAVDRVKQQIDLTPIGLLPARKTDGFVIMNPDGNRKVFAARYRLLATSLGFDHRGAVRLREINFSNYERFTKQDEGKSLVRTVADALVAESSLEHPACFEIKVDGDIPFSQTTLPVVRKQLREAT